MQLLKIESFMEKEFTNTPTSILSIFGRKEKNVASLENQVRNPQNSNVITKLCQCNS